MRTVRDDLAVLAHAVRILIVVAAVITGTQWAVVATVHDWRVVLAVLGVPALLAAATVACVLTVAQAPTRRARTWP
ncbi:MAG TPA: hypothetical protein VF892_17845 [Pseudonocardiaceae bacterium]